MSFPLPAKNTVGRISHHGRLQLLLTQVTLLLLLLALRCVAWLCIKNCIGATSFLHILAQGTAFFSLHLMSC